MRTKEVKKIILKAARNIVWHRKLLCGSTSHQLFRDLKEIHINHKGLHRLTEARSPDGKGYATNFNLKAIHHSLLFLLSNLSWIYYLSTFFVDFSLRIYRNCSFCNFSSVSNLFLFRFFNSSRCFSACLECSQAINIGIPSGKTRAKRIPASRVNAGIIHKYSCIWRIKSAGLSIW